jgi:TonB family protein
MTFLFASSLRSSVVLLSGLLAVRLLKRQPAALRHSILAAAIALAAAQPAIKLAVPALPIPIIQLVPADAQRTEESLPAVQSDIPLDAPARAAVETVAPINWLRVASIIWAGGAMTGLLVILVGLGWLSWVQSHASAARGDWPAIEPGIPILITQHPALIVTWGVIAPVILLPSSAESWSADRKRLVIAHEMAHLLRRDWLVQVLAEIGRSIYWFNPLFWIACARVRRESEYAADDAVLECGIAGTSYASHLVDLARALSVHGRTWLPAPSIARPSTLERRVRAMLNPQLNRRPVSMSLRLASIAVLCAIAMPIAAASHSQNAPTGSVTDPMGRALPDAELRLTDINGGQVFEAKTDSTGAFQFPQVPAGPYLLSVRYPGFSSQRQRLDLNGGGTTITLQVQVGKLRETVTVRADDGGGRPIGTSYSTAREAPPSCNPSAGGQLTPPMKIRDVRPVYRRELIDAGIEGDILMQATIGKDGKIRSVDVISPGNADLEDAAVAAVGQWAFTPTYLNCEPVDVQMFVTVSFKSSR